MRFGLILFLSVFLMAMGGKRPLPPSTPPTTPSQPSIPSAPGAADPYLDQFRSLGALYGANFITQTVTFAFRSIWGSTVGVCYYNSSGRNRIDLSTSAWARGSDVFKEMLVFHELGHCLLGRGHKNSRHSDGRQESLMNSWLFDQRVYSANRDQYLKELFTENSQVNVRSLAVRESFRSCGFGRRKSTSH